MFRNGRSTAGTLLSITAVLSLLCATRAQFTVDDVSGALQDPDAPTDAQGDIAPMPPPDAEARAAADQETDGAVLELQEFSKKGSLFYQCGCSSNLADDEIEGYQELRKYSDRFVNRGNLQSRDGWSNALWAWGQFMDHDIVATVDQDGEPNYKINLESDGKSAVMTLHRLVVDNENGECRDPIVVADTRLDGSMIYGSDKAFMESTLREPNSCRMRTSAGDLLPVTSGKDQAGKHRLIAGDPRVNEHGILTTMHTVFVREHNRLCAEMADDMSMTDDEKFRKAQNVVMAKIQQINVNEFLPALGLSKDELKNYQPKVDHADVSVEFAVAYRFGHDLIPNRIGKFNVVDLFDGEKFMQITSAAGSSDPAKVEKDMASVVKAMVSNKANDLDGRFSDALRNFLFGVGPGQSLGEDLSTRNMFRSFELGIPTYETLAECYGVEPMREAISFTKFAKTENPTLALLKENGFARRGEPLGNVNRAILIDQFHRLIFGPSGLWWENNVASIAGFEDEVQSATLAKIFDANLPESFSGNAFLA